jgi:hypothetical protein
MSDVKFAFFDHASSRIWSTKYDNAYLNKQSLWNRELDFEYGINRRCSYIIMLRTCLTAALGPAGPVQLAQLLLLSAVLLLQDSI